MLGGMLTPATHVYIKVLLMVDKFSELCAKLERLSVKETENKGVPAKRKLKLLKIELKSFNGIAKDFLTFWSQFKRNPEDKRLPNEDKFQYLFQAVVQNSKVARVVENFPATVDNFPKAVAQLQERFS
ncbi:DUF1758 domain-containing protein [Trichonephila inaurata madagascariensis]|uniref:DUF1758 domain-containing protein n=1 Tax=Trichonephila inaurata madagascariensis TaxID=2747483 RepID=A0A8X6KCN7_9ARAC|nr:DUF1758 domain-containing protein [Trichonephila inaurata madagascariensis]